MVRPSSEACDDLWAFLLEHEIVAPDADRTASMLADETYPNMFSSIQSAELDDELAVQQTIWDTITEASTDWRGLSVGPALRLLLDGLEEGGRLDDLVLVMVSDHGESPCVPHALSDSLQCAHHGIPSEWVVQVPVFVSPPAVLEQWQEDGLVSLNGAPWVTSNLAYGLADMYGLPWGDSWPAPQPVGTARSIMCSTAPAVEDGRYIVVLDDLAYRCVNQDRCEATTWQRPDSLGYAPERFEDVPTELLDAVESLEVSCMADDTQGVRSPPPPHR